ncbi:MAG: hypothetical protein VKL39_01545, partial [Leptolyngbyaceae bacterium]|nr:hypothetical protein [Leptolyngbyaceae bacterium]
MKCERWGGLSPICVQRSLILVPCLWQGIVSGASGFTFEWEPEAPLGIPSETPGNKEHAKQVH